MEGVETSNSAYVSDIVKDLLFLVAFDSTTDTDNVNVNSNYINVFFHPLKGQIHRTRDSAIRRDFLG